MTALLIFYLSTLGKSELSTEFAAKNKNIPKSKLLFYISIKTKMKQPSKHIILLLPYLEGVILSAIMPIKSE
jgi:hypothetical protein